LVLDPLHQTAKVDEDVLQRLDVDVRGLRPGLIGPGSSSAWEQPLQFTDEWGVAWSKPASGYACDLGAPLGGDGLTISDLVRYPWPEPEKLARLPGLRQEALRLRKETDCATALAVTQYPFTQCQSLRGLSNWLVDLAGDRPFAEALLDVVTEVIVAAAELIVGEVGDLVDVVCWGDDLSTQRGPMIHPRMYAEVIKPRHKRAMEAIKRHTQAKVFFHSCGSARWLIPHLVDIGVDILNPVQVTAAEMDTALLKRDFGRDICFWGGGCDSQETLPFGTPDQVREEVRRRVGDLAPGGGFVFAAIHHIAAGVPPENVEALYEAALEFGRYGN
jgi:uroporphyrinogen decarboxylase